MPEYLGANFELLDLIGSLLAYQSNDFRQYVTKGKIC